jgi:GH35 family endo-1,4-beta-xylanase
MSDLDTMLVRRNSGRRLFVKTSLATIGLFASSVLVTPNVRAADSLKPDADGYIRDWVMLAPIALPVGRPAGDLIVEEQVKNEAALQPKAGDTVKVNGKELTWKNITASTKYFDFNAILKTENDRAAGYMVTYIECDREMNDVTMALGSNDQGRLYLNGKDIYAVQDARSLELDADKGKVHLNKGVNVVVFKVINEQNSWQGSMRFLDKTGAPVTDLKIKLSPAERVVTLKDTFRDYFRVGTAINRSIVTGSAGFRRTAEEVKKDIALVKEQFNQAVPENEMKWMSLHPRTGKDGYDWAAADAFVEFGTNNHMELAGHTLVWHSQTPHWVFEGTHLPPGAVKESKPTGAENKADARQTAPPPPPATPSAGPPGPGGGPGGGSRGFGGFRPFNLDGPRASREELLERMREHIHTVMGRYKGRIKVWDVVNEAISDGGPDVLRKSPWSVIIGPDFIDQAFRYAHEADPDAILRYNDYGLENPGKRRKLITLIKELQGKKVPVMAIGSQAHLNVSITSETMDQSLAEMKSLGLPIHITELDVNGAISGQRNTGADIAGNSAATEGGLVADADKKLTDAYVGIFRAFLNHRDAVKLVTFWGPNDANSWRRRGRPLLFDADSKPKPAFHAVIKLATAPTAP